MLPDAPDASASALPVVSLSSKLNRLFLSPSSATLGGWVCRHAGWLGLVNDGGGSGGALGMSSLLMEVR